MNAPLPEVLLRPVAAQADLQLATDGVLRYVWESKFGPMLIEVVDGRVFVNSGLVEPLSGTASGEGPDAA